ncbi:MAG: methylated-DNA--[protein]-cysteine S-methyltransferase [Victivallaceae bacterium]|nr:methylated-DNA--[protein]-cysteine S-methyltransferase [Victivallaceae bacterium]
MKKFGADVEFPGFGAWRIEDDGERLFYLRPSLFGAKALAPSALTRQVICELNDYFLGKRRIFDLPLAPAQTVFQETMRRALLTIPYGEITTYGKLAALMGSPRAVRAVGQALHVNPIAVIVPCHRVFAANGIGGFAFGAPLKLRLVGLEKRMIR